MPLDELPGPFSSLRFKGGVYGAGLTAPPTVPEERSYDNPMLVVKRGIEEDRDDCTTPWTEP